MSPPPIAKVDVRLIVIVDAGVVPRSRLAAMALQAAEGGATLIQYRDKSPDPALLASTAREIGRALAGSPVPLLINDHVEVASDVGADGVHLGQEDMDPRRARERLGPDAILGRTIKTIGHASALAGEPVDYACIGGVFATSSKVNPDPPIGLAGLSRLLREIRRLAPHLPVGAIAGITAANAAEVIGAGADGIAVVSAVIAAADPRAAACELRTIVEAARLCEEAGR